LIKDSSIHKIKARNTYNWIHSSFLVATMKKWGADWVNNFNQIATSPSYGTIFQHHLRIVFICQLNRYARTCSTYNQFLKHNKQVIWDLATKFDMQEFVLLTTSFFFLFTAGDWKTLWFDRGFYSLGHRQHCIIFTIVMISSLLVQTPIKKNVICCVLYHVICCILYHVICCVLYHVICCVLYHVICCVLYHVICCILYHVICCVLYHVICCVLYHVICCVLYHVICCVLYHVICCVLYHVICCVLYQLLDRSTHTDFDWGFFRLPDDRKIGLTVSVTGRQGMLIPPRLLIPSLVYPGSNTFFPLILTPCKSFTFSKSLLFTTYTEGVRGVAVGNYIYIVM
jgi:hypothetical protein